MKKMPIAISTMIAPNAIPTISPARAPGGSPLDFGGSIETDGVEAFVESEDGGG